VIPHHVSIKEVAFKFEKSKAVIFFLGQRWEMLFVGSKVHIWYSLEYVNILAMTKNLE
jgi:hypothetical protein